MSNCLYLILGFELVSKLIFDTKLYPQCSPGSRLAVVMGGVRSRQWRGGGELISNLPPSLRYQTSPQLVASLYRGTTNSSSNNWEIYINNCCFSFYQEIQIYSTSIDDLRYISVKLNYIIKITD